MKISDNSILMNLKCYTIEVFPFFFVHKVYSSCINYQNLKTSAMSFNRRMDKLWFIYTVEFNTSEKRDAIRPQKDMENITSV